MKKILSLLLIFLILLTFAPYVSAEGVCAVNVICDSLTSKVSLSGIVGQRAGVPVTVSILKEGKDTDFSKDNTPDIMYLYSTGEGGTINSSILLSKKFTSGKYNVLVDSKAGSEKCSFMFVNDTDADTQAAIHLINTATSKNEIFIILNNPQYSSKIGIDKDDTAYNGFLSDIAEICFSSRANQPSGEYKTFGFLETLETAIAFTIIKGAGDVELAFQRYAQHFGTSFEEFSLIDAAIKEELVSLLVNADYKSGMAKDIYRELLIVAEIKSKESWSDLREAVFKYADDIEIETGRGSKYYSIKDTMKYKVFKDIFDKKEAFKSLSDIKSSFNNSVLTNISDINENRGSSPDRGGGFSVSVSAAALDKTEISEKIESVFFKDTSNHWAKEYISSLNQKGIVLGYEDGLFRPDKEVTRAEFSKMVVLLFDITTDKEVLFEDVSENDWFSPYVKILAGEELAIGFEGRFNPSSNITRQDAAVIVARIIKYLNYDVTGSFSFNDDEKISGYAKEAVAAMTAKGIIIGNSGEYRPVDNITRAEISAMLCRAIDYISE